MFIYIYIYIYIFFDVKDSPPKVEFFFRRKTKNFINTKQLNQLEKQSKLMIDITFFIKKRKKIYMHSCPLFLPQSLTFLEILC